jgi:hypothetical protein
MSNNDIFLANKLNSEIKVSQCETYAPSMTGKHRSSSSLFINRKKTSLKAEVVYLRLG